MVKFSKKSFLIIIVVAILALSIIAGGIAYAQWDKTSQTLADFEVSISDNTVLSIETTLENSQLKLLPKDAIIDKTKETHKLKLADFTATITGDGDDTDYAIKWAFEECTMIGADGNAVPNQSNHDYKKLFNILIYVGTNVEADTSETPWAADTYRDTAKVVNYTVYVTMNDPDTVDGFKDTEGFDKSSIMGKKFSFKIAVDIKLRDKPTA